MYLVGDIGGTNSRFALCETGSVDLLEVRKYPNREFSGLGDAIRHYLFEAKANPTHACIAVAGPILGDEVQLTNVDWCFSTSQLQAQLQLHHFVATNDFTALAMAIPALRDDPALIAQLGPGAPQPQQPISVLGPGTGLGVSALLPFGERWVPIEGEGGQIAFAPGTDLEIALLRYAQKQFGFVSAERLISGQALAFLYNALLAIAGKPPEPDIQPEDVTRGALEDECGDCHHTLEIFLGMLGAFAGDRALDVGAFGGVFIGGGVTPKLEPLFDSSSFRQRFEDKGRFRDYVTPIPTYCLRSHSKIALQGAAQILCQQEGHS